MPLDVLIMSPGGAGTTYFIQYIKQYTSLKVNDYRDVDGLKHISMGHLNRLCDAQPQKIIYLFNDPALTVESIFRRGWQSYHAPKLGGDSRITKTMTKESYYDMCIDEKHDIFGIERQFSFLMSAQLPCPMFCADFSKIDVKKLSAFLQVDCQVFDALKLKPRHCSKNHLPDTYQRIYTNLYHNMSKMHNQVVLPRPTCFKNPPPKPYHMYRLSDTICAKWKAQKDRDYHVKYYPKSLVAHYFDLTTKFNDFDVLAQLVESQRYRVVDQLKKDTIVIHLRLGDVFNMSKRAVDEHLEKVILYKSTTRDILYIQPASYFLEKLKPYAQTKVQFVFGSHKPDIDFTKSWEYLDKLTKILQKHGYTCQRKHASMTNDPDLDFLYLCHAPNLVVSGGGFSHLAKKINGMIKSQSTSSPPPAKRLRKPNK